MRAKPPNQSVTVYRSSSDVSKFQNDQPNVIVLKFCAATPVKRAFQTGFGLDRVKRVVAFQSETVQRALILDRAEKARRGSIMIRHTRRPGK